jgi:hypothetical protein
MLSKDEKIAFGRILRTMAPKSRQCICGPFDMITIHFEAQPIADSVVKTWKCVMCGAIEKRRYGGWSTDYDERDILNLRGPK